MNQLNTVKEKLHERFLKDPFSILKDLLSIFKGSNENNYRTMLMRISEFNMLKKNKRRGVEDSDHQVKLEKIKDTLLELIDEITEKEAQNYLGTHMILDEFLVICRKERRIEEMTKLFPKDVYPNVDFIPEEELFLKNPNDFQLMIYDNFPLEPFPIGITAGLRDVLENSERPVLFHSPDNVRELHNQYSDRVYFSNSKFAIHSRINEMLLFIRTQKFN